MFAQLGVGILGILQACTYIRIINKNCIIIYIYIYNYIILYNSHTEPHSAQATGKAAMGAWVPRCTKTSGPHSFFSRKKYDKNIA